MLVSTLQSLVARQHLVPRGPGSTSLSASQIACSYGDVLVRAWKELFSQSSEVLPMFEDTVLTPLLWAAVHASNYSVFKGLFTVLQFFHNEKPSKGVDSLLLKLYTPVIWRSLKCSNAMVRTQATALFCSVFPLRLNTQSPAEDDEILQNHFNVLNQLLKDPDHRVRSSAVTGACAVLRTFWEAIPAAICTGMLSFMVNQLSRDTSSSNVRVAVIQGLCSLLDCPLAHRLLAKLLPTISASLHDSSEAVRIEMIQMLLLVSHLPDIDMIK